MDTTPEVSEQAVEDRLATILGAEDTEEEATLVEDNAESEEESVEEEPQEEEPTAALEEIEFEGKTYQIPPELKKGFLYQQDYSRKTQEIADYKRQLADQHDYLTAQRQLLATASQDFAELRAAEQQLQAFQQINWQELASADPGRAFALSKQQEQITQLVNGKRARINELAQHAEKATQEHKQVQWKAAVEAAKKATGPVPPEVDAKALQMVQAAFSDKEVHKLADANILQWVVDAARWRLLQESKPGINKRAQEARPVKQIARSAPQAQIAGKAALARQTLKKTGNSNAAEAYFESLFSKRK